MSELEDLLSKNPCNHQVGCFSHLRTCFACFLEFHDCFQDFPISSFQEYLLLPPHIIGLEILLTFIPSCIGRCNCQARHK